MTRVITHLGLGNVELLTNSPAVDVHLEKPFLGKSLVCLSSSDVFHFSDWGIIRAIRVDSSNGATELKLFNLQFYPSKEEAELIFSRQFLPPNETCFLFDLASGDLSFSQALNPFEGNFLVLRPWVDRWSLDSPTRPTSLFRDRDYALTRITAELERIAGCSGITAFVLIDMGEKPQLVKFSLMIAPPDGIIFEKEFPA